jgi:hypothetical protein
MDREGKNPLDDRVEADFMVLPPLNARGRLPTIIGAAERRCQGCGRLRLGQMEDRDEFVDFLGRNLERLTMVKMEKLDFVDEIRRRHGLLPFPFVAARLPAIDNAFQLLHRQVLGTYHGAISQKHLKAYLDEFVFRFNRRASRNRWLLVLRALQSAFQRVPTYPELVHGNLSELERPAISVAAG